MVYCCCLCVDFFLVLCVDVCCFFVVVVDCFMVCLLFVVFVQFLVCCGGCHLCFMYGSCLFVFCFLICFWFCLLLFHVCIMVAVALSFWWR